MHLTFEKLMDDIGRKIAAALEKDARMSYSRLGREVGLSTPAVTERVRKMEEAGIILGYHARIRRETPANAVLAFVELTVPASLYPKVHKLADAYDQVLACHHISGRASFILKVRALSVSELEVLIGELSTLGGTRTSIVMSSPKEG